MSTPDTLPRLPPMPPRFPRMCPEPPPSLCQKGLRSPPASSRGFFPVLNFSEFVRSKSSRQHGRAAGTIARDAVGRQAPAEPARQARLPRGGRSGRRAKCSPTPCAPHFGCPRLTRQPPLPVQELTTQLRRVADKENVQKMSHLLFYGPSGAGKKTRIMALLREVRVPREEEEDGGGTRRETAQTRLRQRSPSLWGCWRCCMSVCGKARWSMRIAPPGLTPCERCGRSTGRASKSSRWTCGPSNSSRQRLRSPFSAATTTLSSIHPTSGPTGTNPQKCSHSALK